MDYIIIFFVVILLIFIYEKNILKSKRISLFFLIFSIFLLSIFAGGRGENIGTDIRFYVIQEFSNNLTYFSFDDFVRYHVLETGYEFLSFIVSRFSSDIHWVHFLNALCGLVGIYIGIYYFSRKYVISFCFCFCLYLLQKYNMSFNLIRQFIAVSLVFCSVPALLEKKYLLYFLISLIAFSFHRSAIITIILLPLYISLRYLLNNKLYFLFSIYMVVMIVCTYATPFIINFALQNGILPSHFSDNLSSYSIETGGIYLALSKLIPLILILLSFRKMNTDMKVLAIFCLISFLLSIVRMDFGAAGRLLYYFDIFFIVMIPVSIHLISSKKIDRFILSFLSVLYYFFIWIYSYPISNYGETFPYEWTWN